MDSIKMVYVILCVMCLPQFLTLSVHLSGNQDKEKRGLEDDQMVSQNILKTTPPDMEGSGAWGLPPTPVVLDLQATGIDRKLLGLPGWIYIIVGLVILFATFAGGGIAIGCEKCSGAFGRRARSDKDSD